MSEDVAIYYKMRDKQYYVYILGNIARTVLYVGITNDLKRRVWEHKQGLVEGFTKRYKVRDLLLYEVFNDPESAIEREKQIKSWKRNGKEELVMKFNQGLVDLYEHIVY